MKRSPLATLAIGALLFASCTQSTPADLSKTTPESQGEAQYLIVKTDGVYALEYEYQGSSKTLIEDIDASIKSQYPDTESPFDMAFAIEQVNEEKQYVLVSAQPMDVDVPGKVYFKVDTKSNELNKATTLNTMTGAFGGNMFSPSGSYIASINEEDQPDDTIENPGPSTLVKVYNIPDMKMLEYTHTKDGDTLNGGMGGLSNNFGMMWTSDATLLVATYKHDSENEFWSKERTGTLYLSMNYTDNTVMGSHFATCEMTPEPTDIGSLAYPVFPEYEGLGILGELLTFVECGSQATYTADILTEEGYTSGLRLTFMDPLQENTGDTTILVGQLGFTCSENNATQCSTYEKKGTISKDDIWQLRLFAPDLTSADCIDCG